MVDVNDLVAGDRAFPSRVAASNSAGGDRAMRTSPPVASSLVMVAVVLQAVAPARNSAAVDVANEVRFTTLSCHPIRR
jgi:hypothetical protein